MKVNKFLALIILAILISNILLGITYEIKAEEIIENEIIEQSQNNKTESKQDTENVIENNIIENDVIENDVIENESIEDNVVEDEVTENNVIDNSIDNEVIDNINNDEIMPLSAPSEELGVTYKTHVQDIGWQDWKNDGETAGTSGKYLRLEAINIKLKGDLSNLNIKYQTHVESIGWQDWKTNGEMSGTSGKYLRLEAIKIELDSSEDYSIRYRVHVQDIGWQDWKTDGEIAGTEGRYLRLEAIEIKIVPKVKKAVINIDTPRNGESLYNPNIINVSGWKMANISNTKIKVYIDESTTPIDDNLITYIKRDDVIKAVKGYGNEIQNSNPGFYFAINATELASGTHKIRFVIYTSNNEMLQEVTTKIILDRNLHVQYKSHVQDIGWQEHVIDGKTSGTEGRHLRIEATDIRLVSAPSNAKIVYRAHIQDIGWQDWKENGQVAGTQGQGLRMEALQIKLENFDEYTIEYQVHVEDKGWTDWYIDGETAGTVGQGKRIEAMRIRLVPKYKRQYNGIDVSQFNGSINWGFVKRSGIDFSFIRVGIRGYGSAGNFREDSNYRANIQAAKQAGVPVGVYFVTQATTEAEAIEEANWVIERVEPYGVEYPIAIDIESPGLERPTDIPRTQNLDKNTRTQLAKVFCQTIQNNGYTPIIYTNLNWANNYLNMSQLTEFDTWIAQYRSAGTTYTGEYSIWQYTSSGTVNGILGCVDLDACYKKY